MKAVLSLLFLSILIFCVWSGYKKGLVMGIFSLIAFVVSVYGANLLSQTYSGEVIDALRPFASGFVEVNVVDKTVRPAMGIDSTNLSVKDYFAQNPGRETEFCTLTYNGMGIYESTSERRRGGRSGAGHGVLPHHRLGAAVRRTSRLAGDAFQHLPRLLVYGSHDLRTPARNLTPLHRIQENIYATYSLRPLPQEHGGGIHQPY